MTGNKDVSYSMQAKLNTVFCSIIGITARSIIGVSDILENILAVLIELEQSINKVIVCYGVKQLYRLLKGS